MKVYENHIEDLLKTVRAYNLLVFNVKDGWERLCRFLNEETPNTIFPQANN